MAELTVGSGTGNKYHRTIRILPNGKVDVYCVLDAFDVRCPARAHAIKKLLCAGIRGKGDSTQDLKETVDAVLRAIELEQGRVDEADELSKQKKPISSRPATRKPKGLIIRVVGR